MKTKLLLALLLLFIAATNWLWLTIDTYPPWWDQADYLRAALRFSQSLRKLDLGGLCKDFLSFNRVRPPLVMLITSPLFLFYYHNEDLAVMINVLFLAITFFAIYKICTHYLTPQAAALSCFILAMYPDIYFYSRSYLIDLGLVAGVTLSIYLLLKTDEFKSTKYSLLLGLSLGLGMLIKQTFFLFIFGPLIYFIWKSRAGQKSRWNFLSSLLVAAILSLSWYLPNFKDVMVPLISNSSSDWTRLYLPAYLNDIKLFLLLLPAGLTNTGISFLFMCLFLCSSLFFFRQHKDVTIKKVFFWWIVLPFLVFNFSLSKQTRFLIAILPAMAMISARGVYLIKNKKVRRALLALIVAVSLLKFTIDSFDLPALSARFSKPLVWRGIILFGIREEARPKIVEWKVEQALAIIKKDMLAKKIKQASAILIMNQNAYNANTLNYFSEKEGLGVYFLTAAWMDMPAAFMAAKNYRYALYKDANFGDHQLYQEKITAAYAYLLAHQQEFQLMEKLHLCDDSNLFIYKLRSATRQ